MHPTHHARGVPAGGSDPRSLDYMRFLGGPGFGPRGYGGRARRGDVRSAILSLLGEGPSNGYGLIKAIQAKTNGAWRPSPGSVYPTLQQLVDEGLIAPIGEGVRTEFDLTDEGRAHLADRADELADAWAAPRYPGQQQGELIGAARKLAAVVRQVAVEGSSAQRASAVSKLDELRRELYRMLGE